jgi:signal transduction histidine kinase
MRRGDARRTEAEAPRKIPSPRRAAESRPSATSQLAQLESKYQAAVNKLQLVAEDRQGVVTLAWWALRTNATALALVSGDRIVVANPRWGALGRGKRLWEPLARSPSLTVDRPPQIRPLTLRQMAETEARELLALPEDQRPKSSVGRWRRLVGDQVIELRLQVVDGKGGNAGKPQVLVMAQDVTRRMRDGRALDSARLQLAQRNKTGSMAELTSRIAHDLLNTLKALSMHVELARRRMSERGVEGDNLHAVDRMTADAIATVARLRDVARQRRDRPVRPIDVSSVIAESVDIVSPLMGPASQPSSARFKFDFDLPELPPVLGVPGELRQMFVNLFLNARDAMPAGGVIQVTAKVKGDQLAVAVADEGVGIPREHIGKIFEPFFTTKGEEGTGLGLSTADDLMSRIGGSIEASNRPQGGAVFTIRFALADRETSSVASRAARSDQRPPLAQPIAAVSRADTTS